MLCSRAAEKCWTHTGICCDGRCCMPVLTGGRCTADKPNAPRGSEIVPCEVSNSFTPNLKRRTCTHTHSRSAPGHLRYCERTPDAVTRKKMTASGCLYLLEHCSAAGRRSQIHSQPKLISKPLARLDRSDRPPPKRTGGDSLQAGARCVARSFCWTRFGSPHQPVLTIQAEDLGARRIRRMAWRSCRPASPFSREPSFWAAPHTQRTRFDLMHQCVRCPLRKPWEAPHQILAAKFSRQLHGGRSALQGYLAHKNPPTPIGTPQGPRHGPSVGS